MESEKLFMLERAVGVLVHLVIEIHYGAWRRMGC